jgi:hypothetical protein
VNKFKYKRWLRKLFRYARFGEHEHPETWIASTLTAHYFKQGKTPLEVYEYLLRLQYIVDPLPPLRETRELLAMAAAHAYGTGSTVTI